MKKHYCIQSFRAKSVLMRCMKKIPLAMRCTLFMLFCLVGMTFANEGYAQKNNGKQLLLKTRPLMKY